MAKTSDRLQLKDALADLRHQVQESIEAAKNEEFQFTLDGVEIELTVVAEASAEAGVEASWWVLKGSAKAAAKAATTHKVTVKLGAGGVKVGSKVSTN